MLSHAFAVVNSIYIHTEKIERRFTKISFLSNGQQFNVCIFDVLFILIIAFICFHLRQKGIHPCLWMLVKYARVSKFLHRLRALELWIVLKHAFLPVWRLLIHPQWPGNSYANLFHDLLQSCVGKACLERFCTSTPYRWVADTCRWIELLSENQVERTNRMVYNARQSQRSEWTYSCSVNSMDKSKMGDITPWLNWRPIEGFLKPWWQWQ